MNYLASLNTLRSQYAYELDVHIRIKEKLTGGYGKAIYSAEWINQKGSPIVLLEMKGENANEEALLYITLHHKHIIETFGLVKPNQDFQNSQSVLLLQEYAKDGDLAGLLTGRYFIPSPAVILEIFIQIVDAMIFLSSHQIIHGDLACRNVLVFQSHPDDLTKTLVKLIDFGLTRDETIPANVHIDIPERYAAPEILRSRGRSGYSEKSDVYSFAVLMWEAFSPEKRMPYDEISDDRDVCEQKLNGQKLTQPNKCPNEIWQLMLKCWHDRPRDRPTFQAIHTQLKNMQNSARISSSNPTLASSSATNRPSIDSLNTENNVRDNFGARHRDYEFRLPHYEPYERHRRDSIELGNELSNRAINILSSSSSSNDFIPIMEVTQIPCEFCDEQFSPNELQEHQRNCWRDQRSHLPKSSSVGSFIIPANNQNQRNSKPPISLSRPDISSALHDRHDAHNTGRPTRMSEHARVKRSQPSHGSNRYSHQTPLLPPKAPDTRNTSILKKPSQVNAAQLPCEICKQLIDATQLKTHQAQCLQEDRARVEEKRRQIEEQQNIERVTCDYCQGQFSLNEWNDHENICDRDPKNRRKTTNIPNIYSNVNSSKRQEINFSSLLNNNRRSSNVGFDAIRTDNIENERNKPSRLRKLASRLWPFKKK